MLSLIQLTLRWSARITTVQRSRATTTGAFVAGSLFAAILLTGNQSQISLDSEKGDAISNRTHALATSAPFVSSTILQREERGLDKFDPKKNKDSNERLRAHEQSFSPPPTSGISRYDIVQVASNNPCEDDHAEAVLPTPSGYWAMFALFDGHSGWETAAWLRENMIPAVVGALADLYENFRQESAFADIPPQAVEHSLKTIFKLLDDDIVHSPLDHVFENSSRHYAVNVLAPAYAGSCALLSFYDSHSRRLHVAITGDSRAVLGRRVHSSNGEASYEVYLLSAEQDGRSPAEEARLNSKHPGEHVVKDGRVLGMSVSRAFGDARYKWSLDTQRRLKRDYLGRSLLPSVKTPPYLTAEPEVTCIQVQPGDFLIMATDGLWECLTSEEAVGLVAWWRDRAQEKHMPSLETLLFKHDAEHYHDDTVRYRQWNADKAFEKVDGNAATHLVRNALGGADGDLRSALLSLRSPRARVYRDDITALVVFFDEEQ
ncbi:protein serine/threonine phosphatase 2C [Panus rudis PR-1116 ss-1]|nr:protein serine/threonine phosphatase 2C [Panus rudis PR-1116 ss-1]